MKRVKERSFLHVPELFMFLLLCWFSSCNDHSQPVENTVNFTMTDDTVIKYNREIVQAESQDIEDFISRYKWNMVKTPTGLRYMIYKQGSGRHPVGGDQVTINYSLKLLDGKEIVKPGSSDTLKFKLSTGKVPGGLEEGIMLMTAGARAKLVVPSHLAFGLLGDLDNIPNRAVLVYDVELCRIN
ncbi:MAG: FKBP-type peptidyl-prolyl cis-trans isomerase [Bacteroidales bacterium]|nr:FKBP-type peptidyl-prolyl cis-trans isomerase [Bacteroidales bacterium]HNW73804.1 FKBP-type peptidyl-prolyl cis-trans isomerase [Bacteroidales bacterium]HPS50669.1 FKBP-type peptidyl-prolyl cis-trans isomerase [Bacteroidales bacterium]